MAIVESRLKTGTLTFGDQASSVSFACQATNVRVTPTYNDDGDPLETLCGDSISAAKKGTWQLQGTSVQDFDDPDGFLAYCFDNEMTAVPFKWTANSKSPTWGGTCTIVALEEGGDVNTRLTTDWAFDVAGKPTRTYASTTGTNPGGNAATGATAGTPGTFTPSGATAPASVAELTSKNVTASPATAWTTGQYVQTGTSGAAGEAHWTGSAWAAGKAS